jgi:hypothetical protein
VKGLKCRRFSRAEIGLAVASLCAIAYGVAQADGPQPHLSSSSWGLAEGQTARVTVTNVYLNPDEIKVDKPEPWSKHARTDGCVAQIKVYAADGSVLKVSEALKIAPGASAFRDLKHSELQTEIGFPDEDGESKTDPGSGRRFQLRAESFVMDNPDFQSRDSKNDTCSKMASRFYKFSVEVFDDDTGRTTFSVPVSPQPIPIPYPNQNRDSGETDR